MRIALCDDSPEDLARLKALTEEWARRTRDPTGRGTRPACPHLEICTFNHPDALLRVAEKSPFDLYLLDVIMDMITGIQLVEELMNFQKSPRAIFFSTSRDFAYEAIQMDAITYIGKPYTEERFFAAMDRAFALMEEDETKLLTLGIEGHLRRFRTDEIEYVTPSDTANYTCLHLSDGTTVGTRSSIRTFAEEHQHLLPLTRLTRSLFVNPMLVCAIDVDEMRFFSGHTLRFPRRVRRTLQDAVLTCSAT